MKYNEMKEITIAQWDGKPFYAYVTDDDDDEVDKGNVANIGGWFNGHWLSISGVNWNHAYPLEWNEPKIIKEN